MSVETSPGQRRGKRAKSEPRRWRQPLIPRGEIYRLSPKPPVKRRGRVWALWDRVRLAARTGWPWAAVALMLVAAGRYGTAAPLLALSILLFLFAPRLARPACELDYPFGSDSADFLYTIQGATGTKIVESNRLAVHQNGDEFYPAMLGAVAKAEYSITMEQYILWAGEIGTRFAEAFAERAKAGVSVKLLVDAVGSATIGRRILTTLEEGGCQLAWYRPIRWFSPQRANRRNHRKSLIVDGRLAFTGGAGIGDHWLGNAEDRHHWRDTMIELEGPAVAALQTGFAQNWLETTGELLTGARYYPPAEVSGDVAAAAILSSPFSGVENATIMISLALLCARRNLYIANPYFVPGPEILEMLRDCRQRVVDVKVMVAGVSNDVWLARQNSVRLYGRLLEAGIEMYEYNRTMMHQKTMVVDDVWAVVATANFDNRSFALNEETSVCFYDQQMVDEMRRVFLADLAVCEKVDLERWRRRGIWARAGEVLSSFLQDQV